MLVIRKLGRNKGQKQISDGKGAGFLTKGKL